MNGSSGDDYSALSRFFPPLATRDRSAAPGRYPRMRHRRLGRRLNRYLRTGGAEPPVLLGRIERPMLGRAIRVQRIRSNRDDRVDLLLDPVANGLQIQPRW